jgi:hypothetical protein
MTKCTCASCPPGSGFRFPRTPGPNITNYDVFPGDKELLMIRASPVHLQVAVIQNWPELPRQRAVVR